MQNFITLSEHYPLVGNNDIDIYMTRNRKSHWLEAFFLSIQTIVVTSELPQNISTLWLRLLGRGPTQRAAIMELNALDENHPHCVVVRQQLREWYQLLSNSQMFKEGRLLMQTLASI